MARPKICVRTLSGKIVCGKPVGGARSNPTPKRRIEARNRRTGQIARSKGMCVCGHDFSLHECGGPGGGECVAFVSGMSEHDCGCDEFRAVKRPGDRA